MSGPADRPAPADPDASGITKSSAWRDAEQAFAEPPPVAPAPAVVVTVRRTRGVEREPDPAAGEGSAAGEAPDDKGSRVFTIGAAPATEPVDSGSSMPAQQRRTRRIAVDKRPGPVLQVFRAPAAPAGPPESPADLLAALEPIFDDIRQAQSFHFIDESAAATWLLLSRRADQLLHDIASLDAAPAPGPQRHQR